jgi:hypothetical protein
MTLSGDELKARMNQKTFDNVPKGYEIVPVGKMAKRGDLIWFESSGWQPLSSSFIVKCAWIARRKKVLRKIKWESVDVEPSDEDAIFTLVKVKGWQRYGFACFSRHSGKWITEHTDPSCMIDNPKIISWLRVPKIG